MKKWHYLVIVFLSMAIPLTAQKHNYNCIVLDSIISAIQSKKQQNDFLLPLFKSGDIKTTGDSVYVITKDSTKVRQIESVLGKINVRERNLFLDDALFTLDTFNVIVDTFRYFDNSCVLQGDDKNYIVVNDYKILRTMTVCNAIIVESITYNNNGAITIFFRNTKSNFVVAFGIRQSSFLYPSISILGKYLFDPVEGISLE